MKTRPNFANAYSKANEILVKSTVIAGFPFSALDLVKEQSKIKCRTFKKAMSHGSDILSFGSKSAIIVKYGERSIIFYDDEKPMCHVKFSILHELGHPINNHDFSPKDSETYGNYEVETNYFAAQLLMPEQILRELQQRGNRITHEFLQKHFEVSYAAADKRITTLARSNVEWRSRMEREYDDIILFKYKAFLDTISPNQEAYSFEAEYSLQLARNQWY